MRFGRNNNTNKSRHAVIRAGNSVYSDKHLLKSDGSGTASEPTPLGLGHGHAMLIRTTMAACPQPRFIRHLHTHTHSHSQSQMRLHMRRLIPVGAALVCWLYGDASAPSPIVLFMVTHGNLALAQKSTQASAKATTHFQQPASFFFFLSLPLPNPPPLPSSSSLQSLSLSIRSGANQQENDITVFQPIKLCKRNNLVYVEGFLELLSKLFLRRKTAAVFQ